MMCRCSRDRTNGFATARSCDTRSSKGSSPTWWNSTWSATGPNFKPRPSFSLPWGATGLLPPGTEFHVRLIVDCDSVVNDAQSGSAQFQFRTRTYRFPRRMQWVVQELDAAAPVAVGRVIDAVAARLDEDVVRMLLAMLVKEHLLAITE